MLKRAIYKTSALMISLLKSASYSIQVYRHWCIFFVGSILYVYRIRQIFTNGCMHAAMLTVVDQCLISHIFNYNSTVL